ncbi:hypothetical protein [Mucilaginibacter sp. BT774]|uniref:hypothetical protein n=1 Tax=Mucilaginibacter sp. BT774 TaxID=3062276 RepID=UPI0026747826|nr:hypothetical protein [Mucilaginibacter sp. BT774]MDO3626619.1 hypothetical protein [Mucilaginibacter sp. BT774]
MKTQEEWEDKHLQVHRVTAVAKKVLKKATKTGNRVIKTQGATGEMVKKQQ